jgi:phosphohistidine phosphatase SixA
VHSEPRLAPGFDTGKLAGMLQEYADARALLLVGHEPSFSTVIAHLIDGGRVMMKKGAVARVDLADPAELRGDLVWLLPPKVLMR